MFNALPDKLMNIMMSPRLLLAAALLPIAGATLADAQQLAPRAPVSRMIVVREQRTVRIPLQPMTALPVPRPIVEWTEERGPKCLVRANIAAASVNGLRSVDFILRDRTRHRAQLQNSCPALDYYAGFYLKPTADGKICQDRDAVHARSGGECQIDRFRKLTPAKAR